MKFVNRGFLIGVFFLFSAGSSQAELLPESHNQQYLTYGLLLDHQSSLLWRGSGKAIGSISANLPLWQPEGGGPQPQLIFTADVIAGWFVQDGAFNSDEDDSVMKLAWNTWLSSDLLFSVGVEHTSGHTADDTHSHELDPYDAGIEDFPIRLIYDGALAEKKLRIGSTLKPLLGATPAILWLNLDEFFEYFPFGHFLGKKTWVPYLAGGLTESGHNRVEMTAHVQIGAYLGNHVEARHFTSARVVLGYYTGPDTREKFYLFKNSRQQFGYAGLMFDL